MIYDPLKQEVVKREVFDPLKTTIDPVAVTSSIQGQNRRVPLYASLKGLSQDEVAQLQAKDNGFSITEDAKVMAETNSSIIRENRVLAAIDKQEKDVAKVAVELAKNLSQISGFSGLIDPVVMSAVYSSDNALAKDDATKTLRKALIANDVATEAMEAMTSSGVGGFTTSAISSMTPVYNLFSVKRRQELNRKALDLFNSDISEEEFKEQFKALVTEAGDTFDWLRDGNKYAAQDWLSTFVSYNSDGSSAIDYALASLELTPAGVASSIAKPVAKTTAGVFRVGMSLGTAGLDTIGLGSIVLKNKDKDWVLETLLKEATIDDPRNSAINFVANTSPSISRTSFAVPRTLSTESSAAVKAFEEVETLNRVLRSTQGPIAIEESTLETLRTNMLTAQRNNGSRQVIDADVGMDDFGNIFYAELHGTRGGLPFADERAARAYQKVTNADEVFEDPTGGWFVVKRANVPLVQDGENLIEKLRLFSSTDPEQLGAGFFAKYGSPMAQTTDRLQGLLILQEGATALGQKIAVNDLQRLINAMPRKQIQNVDTILTALRDGGPQSARKTSYTQLEFENEYFLKFTRKPTEKETLLYLMTQKLNDVDWLLKSDIIFKEEVVKGTVVFRNTGEDFTARVVKTDDIANDDVIWDADAGKAISKDQLKPDSVVYAPAQGPAVEIAGKNYDRIATTKPNVRRLTHADVLARNAGGPRNYVPNEIKFYIKQDDKIYLAGGKPKAAKPNTFMGVRTFDEASKAVKQINNIVKAIEPMLVSVPSNASKARLIAALKASPAAKQLDSVIAANNEWNQNIGNTIEGFITWAEDNDFNIREVVGSVTDKTPFTVELGSDFGKGASYGDLFRTASVSKGGRRPTPLIGYGGHENYTISPIETIRGSLLGSIAKQHESQYLSASVNGLIKTTLEAVVKKENISRVEFPEKLLEGKTLRGQLAQLKDSILNGDDPVGAKLLLEAEKIEWRLGANNFDAPTAWFQETFSDYFYGKGGFGKKISRRINMFSTDLSSFFRGVAFDAKLGMFAYDQYYVQASGLINILAIADTKAAIAGSALYPVVRGLLHNGNKSILEATAKRIAPIVGMTETQFVEMVEILRESGRTLTSLSNAELMSAPSQKLVGGVREAGRVFYNEGELVNTITAHATAYQELVTKFPNISPSSRKGKEWIATRQNVLRSGMTGANRSVLQQAPMLQFLTYSFRMSEAMLAGTFGGASRSVLTNKEKAKLATAHLAVYGVSAVPFGGKILEKIDREYGIPVSEETYNLVRRGLLDYTLSTLLETETAMSSRLAFGEGVSNTIYNMLDLNVLELLSGPSGSISTEIFKDTTNFLWSLKSGVMEWDFKLASSDLHTALRNIKTVDMVSKAYIGIMLGEYYSKNSTNTVADIDVYEAVALGLGVPIEKLQSMYALSAANFANSKAEKDTIKRIEQLFTRASVQYKLGDREASIALRKEGLFIFNSLPFESKQRAWSQMQTSVLTDLDVTLQQTLKNDFNTRNLE